MFPVAINNSGTLKLEWLVAAGFVSWGVLKLYRMGRREADLPPGPPTVPILGNLRDIAKGGFLQFTAWARQYGEIYSLLGGPTGTMIVLSSPEAMYDIFERNGALTSNRPKRAVMDYTGGGMALGMAQYNAYWRSTRRAAYEILKPAACVTHLPIQMAESTQLMYDIMTTPKDTFTHGRRYTFSIMLSVMFGQRTPQISSPYITRFFRMFERLSVILLPRSTPPLEMFPLLRYVPERWAPWKTVCKALREDQRGLFFGLLDESEKRVGRGESNGCYIETVMDMGESLNLNREEIGYFGWSMISGGVSTSAAWLHFFLLCMTAHPEVQRKAQEEIDGLVGSERSPVIEDFESLPYVDAIIKETLRFRPILPMSLPHVSSAEVLYKNYRIPKGSMIVPNLWGMFHDETLYDNPEEFNPERFMESPMGLRKDVRQEDEEVFKRLTVLPWGNGRRSCPGIHLANQTLAITAMSLLWAFDFNLARDSDGKEIPIDLWAFTKGSALEPLPFVIDPRVRSPAHAEIIRKSFLGSEEVFAKFEREMSEEDRRYVEESRTVLGA